MTTRTSRGFRLPVPLLALALAAVPWLQADSTFTFQNGVNGYSGAKDVSINTQYAESNGGNGVLWRGG